MIRQNRKIQFIILLTLVCLVGTMTIAYAVLSTTLNINGTAQVMDASWNVHFENIQVNPGSVAISPKITDNDKINFSADLTTPGQFYKFTVDIVNSGSIDAMIETVIINPELTTEQKKYLKYEVEYVDGNSINERQLLNSEEIRTISVYVSYRNDIPVGDLPNVETNLDLEIRLVYVQATSFGEEIPNGSDKLVRILNGDYNTVGSEICIGEECFYLIESDNKSVTLLSKYNLHVGNRYDPTNGSILLENPTGIQASNAIGYFYGYSANNPIIGAKEFALTNYWSSFVTQYPAYVYNEDSHCYQDLENYKVYLEQLGIIINDVRFITVEELEGLGCNRNIKSCSDAPSWVYSTSYWSGTVDSAVRIWTVYSDSDINNIGYDNYNIGVRPVVVVPIEYF